MATYHKIWKQIHHLNVSKKICARSLRIFWSAISKRQFETANVEAWGEHKTHFLKNVLLLVENQWIPYEISIPFFSILFYVVPIRATRRSRQFAGKRQYFHFSVVFWKTLNIGLAPGIEPVSSPVERSLPTELVLLQVRLVRYYDAQSLFVIKKGENMFLHLCLYVTYCRAESYVWIFVLRCDTKMY